MKRFLFISLIILSSFPVFAKHITGGEFLYDFISSNGGSKTYAITLRLFRDNFCTGCAVMPTNVALAIYNNDDNSKIGPTQSVPINSTSALGIISAPPCLTNPPVFDYSAGFYNLTLTLPDNANGYTIVYQTCCRVDGIENIGMAGMIGSTFSGTIPGSNTLQNGTDNSARFVTGISIICKNKKFTLDFSATDADGDQLEYSFANAYNGGAAQDASFTNPAPPPFSSVPYSSPFSGSNPLGPLAVINTSTGIISGIAPDAGKYIVCVMVKSKRNGIVVAEHRKDFIVTVAPCDFGGADLSPNIFYNCNSRIVSFSNVNTSILNTTFLWNFGDPSTGPLNTSTQEFPTHEYSAPGDYTLKLIVNANTPCADSTTALVRVWPGFFPAVAPVPTQCKNTPVQFKDITTTNHGVINYWKWDFGVTNLTNDTSRLSTTTYTYPNAGNYVASLIVSSSKGCRDTIIPINVTITDKPDFFISKDTLICTVDTLLLRSNVTTGAITWSPNNTTINNTTSYNPLVSPDVTTTYTANYVDPFGCVANASVTISVVNAVTLLSANDTTICLTDKAQLNINTDALYFTWTPASLIENPTVKNPIVLPAAQSTTFNVLAKISNKCFKNKNITVFTVPYPVPTATSNSPICFGKNAQLNSSGGSIYSWSPAIYLSNANIPNPIVLTPLNTTDYTVTVKDTLGCPKPVSKTVKVEVIKIIANAGPSDTSIVLGQPLQLQGTGSTNYLWTPNTWLSDDNVSNPISNAQNNITYNLKVSNAIGCESFDSIRVKVFFLPPDIYVPTAFTPDGNSTNDNFKPIPIGIKSLENFSIYNRWGQLIFSTSQIGKGWDGTYKGVKQDAATYVWQATATDYKGTKISRKNTFILIR
jgi:gliding motility-associated-like protein